MCWPVDLFFHVSNPSGPRWDGGEWHRGVKTLRFVIIPLSYFKSIHPWWTVPLRATRDFQSFRFWLCSLHFDSTVWMTHAESDSAVSDSAVSDSAVSDSAVSFPPRTFLSIFSAWLCAENLGEIHSKFKNIFLLTTLQYNHFYWLTSLDFMS